MADHPPHATHPHRTSQIRNAFGRLTGRSHAPKAAPRITEEAVGGLAEPAVPPDVDLFTLEDLEEGEDLTVPLHQTAAPYTYHSRYGNAGRVRGWTDTLIAGVRYH